MSGAATKPAGGVGASDGEATVPPTVKPHILSECRDGTEIAPVYTLQFGSLCKDRCPFGVVILVSGEN